MSWHCRDHLGSVQISVLFGQKPAAHPGRQTTDLSYQNFQAPSPWSRRKMEMDGMGRADRNPAFPWEGVFEAGLYGAPAALFSEKRGRKTFCEQLTSLFLSIGTSFTSTINSEDTKTVREFTELLVRNQMIDRRA